MYPISRSSTESLFSLVLRISGIVSKMKCQIQLYFFLQIVQNNLVYISTFFYSSAPFLAILFDSFMLKSSLLRFLLAHLCAKPKKNFCIEEEDEKRNVSTIAKCLNRKFSRGKVHFLQILLQMKIPCESSTQKEIAFLLN